LEMSSQFETFGFTAAEVARKQAEKEQQKRSASVFEGQLAVYCILAFHYFACSDRLGFKISMMSKFSMFIFETF